MQRTAARVSRLLAHPLTRGLDLDDPSTTRLRREVIRSKPFLRRLYASWYALLERELPDDPRPALELGSGAGFLGQVARNLLSSDVVVIPGVALVADGQHLPIADQALRAVVMVNVLHHVKRPELLLAECGRCVAPGGVLAMVEPWVTTWSRLVYGHLHHEPFDPAARQWTVSDGGPLSAANGALPWILFERDRELFESRLPGWSIERVAPTNPLAYLVSGGVSLRSLMPGWSFCLWRALERLLAPLRNQTAMFALVVLRRR